MCSQYILCDFPSGLHKGCSHAVTKGMLPKLCHGNVVPPCILVVLYLSIYLLITTQWMIPSAIL